MTTNIHKAVMPDSVALSVMIPNFNYGRYIGETIESVLAQEIAPDQPQFEIVVCDNASTDDSVSVVRSYGDPRIRLAINPCNVGFSANLERVAAMARGRRMLLLSSDDRMTLGALAAYERLEEALGPRADTSVWGSSTAVIDSSGQRTGVQFEPDPKCWRDCKDEPELSKAVGFPVRSISAAVLLRRSLELLRSPLPFLTTCYPRALHDAVGSYAGGRLMNPDKWFLWKVLSAAETVYKIDHPLFEYRVHDAGQGPQELRSGALKHLADEYIATFNLPEEVLRKAGMQREQLAEAFIEQDIALRGLLALSQGRRRTARRGIDFGRAAYPELLRANRKVWALRALLMLGPVGTRVAAALRERIEQRWKEQEARPSPDAR
ncbi:MAG TPA: glycosyltransferase family 2 protein [Kofleriaceae bacterium]|nr:glycosyltransferase family 2 protein [Kofleriaceae bacterium]